jgi:hypothetical protein
MIRKSGNRFSEKIMLKQGPARAAAQYSRFLFSRATARYYHGRLAAT